jgi:hypothetical protein
VKKIHETPCAPATARATPRRPPSPWRSPLFLASLHGIPDLRHPSLRFCPSQLTGGRLPRSRSRPGTISGVAQAMPPAAPAPAPVALAPAAAPAPVSADPARPPPQPLLLRPQLPCCHLLRTSFRPISRRRSLGHRMLFQSRWMVSWDGRRCATGAIGCGASRPLLLVRVLLTVPSPSGGGCTADASGAWSRVTALPAVLVVSGAWHAAALATASAIVGSIGRLLLLCLLRHTRTLGLQPGLRLLQVGCATCHAGARLRLILALGHRLLPFRVILQLIRVMLRLPPVIPRRF